jgi:hypothetical protein
MRFSGPIAGASLDWKGPIEEPVWAGLSTTAVWHSTMLHKEPFPAERQPTTVDRAGGALPAWDPGQMPRLPRPKFGATMLHELTHE